MMKLKKAMAIALSATMCAALLSGCTKSGGGEVLTPPEPAPVEEVEVPELDGYTLLWHDEFSGAAMDDTIWSYDPHEPGWTNEELQEYTESTDNVFTRDGMMVLKAIKTTDANGNDYYTSGKIKSQNKEDFMYGKVVARAKVPEGKGLWPAIWMMPTDESYYGQWPKCGEIDIMEVLGSDTTTAYGTVHYGAPHAEQQGTVVKTSPDFAADFHEYSVEWEPGEMRWYIDDELYLTVNDWFTAVEGEEEKPYPAPFNQTFFVQMNLAVGGTWPGNPDETTNFDNAEFLIDYVRVYQKPEYDTNVEKPAKNYKEADETGNFITMGDFSDPDDLGTDLAEEKDWTFLLFEGGEGSASIEDGTMVIKTDAEGTVDYSVQLVQPGLPMIKGHNYKLTFECWADEERDLITCVSAPTAGWVRYLQDTQFTVTTEPQEFEYNFRMNMKDDNNGRLEFNMGNKGSTATIYIKNVRLEEVQ